MEPAGPASSSPPSRSSCSAAIPYWDRSNAGQGKWFASKDSIKITIWAFCIASLLTIWLILYDGAKHVEWTEDIIRGTGLNSDFTWPTWLDWARNLRGLDTGINWDDLSFSLGGFTIFENWRAIPLGIPGTTTDPWLLNLNFPSFLSQQVVPVATMVGLPLLLVGFTKRKLGWIHSRRDIALVVFTGFIAVFIVTTSVGQFFRGQGQELHPPWDIVVVEE